MELQNFLEKMVDKLISLKMIDMEHDFELNSLKYKTHYITKVFSLITRDTGIMFIRGFIYVMKKRSPRTQTQPPVFNSRITICTLLSEEKSI